MRASTALACLILLSSALAAVAQIQISLERRPLTTEFLQRRKRDAIMPLGGGAASIGLYFTQLTIGGTVFRVAVVCRFLFSSLFSLIILTTSCDLHSVYFRTREAPTCTSPSLTAKLCVSWPSLLPFWVQPLERLILNLIVVRLSAEWYICNVSCGLQLLRPHSISQLLVPSMHDWSE